MIQSEWQNKNIFVTGASGFLGFYIVKSLADGGANVTILLRDDVPDSQLFKTGYINKVNVVRGCLTNYFLIERILGEFEIDTIFHIAAQTIVEIANRNPLSTFESNIKGTINILEAARRSPMVKKIVIASSDKAYGIHNKLPYDETAPLKGEHPYDVSKSAADMLARAYYVSYDLPVSITRCGNFFGGGDINFSRLIPGTIRSVLHDEAPIIRSDGSFIRDYFYIEDGANAYITLAEKMNDKSIHGEAFNFSNENQITALEVVEKIIKLMGSNLKPNIINTASNEIPHQYLSAEKARNVLGWRPIFEFDDALGRTIEWYKDYFSANNGR